MNFLVTSAFAQGTAAGEGGSSGFSTQLLQFAPLILIFVVFYVLMIRPQQQKAKDTKAMLSALKRGDRVVTGGGLLATVQRVREGSNEVEIELAPNVRVIALRETISSVVTAKPEGVAGAKGG